MTSKSLFSNLALVWEAIKKKSWVMMVASVVFFFALPVVLVISLQNFHSSIYTSDFKGTMITFLRDFMGTYAVSNLIIITVFAFMAGIIFFAYMHSKRKVDLYHSLPITRTKLFLINYFAGALSVLLPYIVFYLSAIIIIGGFGDLQYIRKAVLFQGLLIPIIYFFAVYSLVILGGILTGNVILQGCASLYIIFIIPGVILVYNLFMDGFFVTYAGAGTILGTIAAYTSPVANIIFSSSQSAYGLMDWSHIISLVFFGVIGLVLGLFLYNKRPSEAAGKSVAFPWFGAVVKYPLIVLGSLCIAMLFYETSPNSSKAWLVFGFIVGALLVSRIMEVIIAQDIKAIKTHWLNLVVSIVITGCILSVFVFDLTNYNQYVPAPNKVETVNIEISGVNMYGEGYYSNEEMGEGYYSYYPLGDRTEITTSENIDAALEIAKNGVANLDSPDDTRADRSLVKSIVEEENYEDTYTEDDLTDAAIVNAFNKKAQCSVVIKYTLTNGRTVARMYNYVDKAATSQPVKTIIDSQEFRTNQLKYLDDEKLTLGDIMYLDTEFTVSSTMFSNENKQAVIEAYKNDVYGLTLDDMTTKKVVGYISFVKYGVIDFNGYMTAPIYETYENTLGVLANLGYGIDEYGTLKPENIASIREIVYEDPDTAFEDNYESVGKENFLDPSDFEDILNSTRSDNEALYNYFLVDNEDVGYILEGKLNNNEYNFSLYRSPMDYWE